MNLETVIKRPLITEKTALETDSFNRFSFVVDLKANKNQIKNAVEANILSALNIGNQENQFEVFNIAFGESNSLDTLSNLIVSILEEHGHIYSKKPIYRDFRAGDIKDSLADISKAKNLISYTPFYSLEDGLRECIPWYMDNRKNNA